MSRDWLWSPGYSVVLAASLALGFFGLTGSIGIDLSDEGYLWYGVIRTAAGDLPLRDFQSYDPGRYLWSAAWSLALGQGIVSLRLSLAIFQVIGLSCGLLAARRISTHPASQAFFGLVLLLWAYPRHKLFESSMAMINVYIATRVMERPTPRTIFVCGVIVGLCATFGRNHGLFYAVGQLAVLLLVFLRARPARPLHLLWCMGGGIVLGYLPVLILVALAPGFAEGFFASLRQLGTMPRPIPWPWLIAGAPYQSALHFSTSWLTSICYLALALGYPVILLVALRRRGEPMNGQTILYACACIGAGNAHHAFNRADVPHLAQAIHPFILGMLALPMALRWSTRGIASIWGSVALITVTMSLYMHRQSIAALFPTAVSGPGYTTLYVGEDRLQLPKRVAEELSAVEVAIRSRVPADEPLFILPYRPLYYPFLDRQAPTWGIFFLRAGQGESDAEMIRKLEEKGVDWILLTNGDIADIPPLTQIRPLLMSHIQSKFRPVPHPLLGPPYRLLQRRQFRGI